MLKVALLCAVELPNLKVNLKGVECVKKMLYGLFKDEKNIQKVRKSDPHGT